MSNTKSIENIIYKENNFIFLEEEGEWCKVYVDLFEYKSSESIYTVYFSHIYCELLYDICKALNMPYLFSFVPYDSVIDDSMFYGEKTKKIKNKELIIRQSAYLQHIVKTYEENNYDIFHPLSVHAIFEYDDVRVVEIVRNVILEFLIKSSDTGISEGLKNFKKNTERALKLKKENESLINGNSSSMEVGGNNVQPVVDEELLTRTEAGSFLKVSLPTLSDWTKKGKIKSYGMGGRVYYKKNEILELLEELK